MRWEYWTAGKHKLGHLNAKSSVSTLKSLFHAEKLLMLWCLVVSLIAILLVLLSGIRLNSSSSSGLVVDSWRVPKSTYAYDHTLFLIDNGTCEEIIFRYLLGMLWYCNCGRIPGVIDGMSCFISCSCCWTAFELQLMVARLLVETLVVAGMVVQIATLTAPVQLSSMVWGLCTGGGAGWCWML